MAQNGHFRPPKTPKIGLFQGILRVILLQTTSDLVCDCIYILVSTEYGEKNRLLSFWGILQ